MNSVIIIYFFLFLFKCGDVSKHGKIHNTVQSEMVQSGGGGGEI